MTKWQQRLQPTARVNSRVGWRGGAAPRQARLLYTQLPNTDAVSLLVSIRCLKPMFYNHTPNLLTSIYAQNWLLGHIRSRLLPQTE